jgi:ADP-ribosylglycohydrolase
MYLLRRKVTIDMARSAAPCAPELPLERARLSLQGLSIGDAFGQCFFAYDNVDPVITARQLPAAPWHYTDDTVMALSVVASLARFGRIDQDSLAIDFADRYEYDRAYGPSMHRTLDRIRNGENWRAVASDAFGGMGSWGNGAAMRAAPIGAFFSDDLETACQQARLSAVVTHAHDEGVAGAIAVAAAAALATRYGERNERPSAQRFLVEVAEHVPYSEVRSRLLRAQYISEQATLQFAISVLGHGVEMSAQDTVPFALWCCGHYLGEFSEALWLAVSAGGDRDTLCAIVGSVVVMFTGANSIPTSWTNCREPLPSEIR